MRQWKAFLSSLYLDFHKKGRTIFLTGTGRSGTTWLAKVLNYDNDYRLIFEPLHPEKVKLFEDYKFIPVMNSVSENNGHRAKFDQLFRGYVRSFWTDVHNTKRFVFRNRLVKSIRSNHILEWLVENYPDVCFIHVLRNPFAVAHSKLKRNWNTSVDPRILEYLRSEFSIDIQTAKITSDFHRYILQWCIENFIPINRLNATRVKTIYYEDIYMRNEEVLEDLFHHINHKYDREKLLTSLKEPSPSCRSDSPVLTGRDPLRNWMNDISRDEIEGSYGILRLFSFENVYGEDGMPNR